MWMRSGKGERLSSRRPNKKIRESQRPVTYDRAVRVVPLRRRRAPVWCDRFPREVRDLRPRGSEMNRGK